jgi:hypothetical protein
MPLPASPIDRISSAMTIASLRGQVIASNIANRDTPDDQRIALSFRQALDGSPQASVVPDTQGAGTPLEMDLVELSANTGSYSAMARVLGRYFSIVGAITSSRN